ncbi:hypothetical protein ACHAP3_004781 [Botrytis cinerea]
MGPVGVGIAGVVEFAEVVDIVKDVDVVGDVEDDKVDVEIDVVLCVVKFEGVPLKLVLVEIIDCEEEVAVLSIYTSSFPGPPHMEHPLLLGVLLVWLIEPTPNTLEDRQVSISMADFEGKLE